VEKNDFELEARANVFETDSGKILREYALDRHTTK